VVKVASKEHTASTHAKQPKQKVGRPPKTKSYETVLQLDTKQDEKKITFKTTGWIGYNPNNKKRKYQKRLAPPTAHPNRNDLVQVTNTSPIDNKKRRTAIMWKDLFEENKE